MGQAKLYRETKRKSDGFTFYTRMCTPICLTENVTASISRLRGLFFVCLMWVAFPISIKGDFAVGLGQENVLMSWRTNVTDISETRSVVNPAGVKIIHFDPYDVTGTAASGYNNKVTEIGNVSLGTVSFCLQSLTLADAGKYYYTGSASDSADGGHVLVIAGIPANITVMEVSDPLENKKYTMQCSAQSTSVPLGMGLTMHYQWKKENGQNITVSDRYSFSSDQSNLIINPLQRQDSGNFVCEAWEHVGAVSQSAPFSLKVIYGPDSGNIQLSPNRTSHEVAESSSLSVNCSTDCFPDCLYRWTGPDRLAKSDTRMLSIIYVGRYKSGHYTCTASNSRIANKTATSIINVVVFYGPDDRNVSLTPSNTSYQLIELSRLDVKCSATCFPQCNYQWSGPLVSQNDNTGLSIPQISRYQTGTFTCTVTNPKIPGKSSIANFSIIVYYGPDIPYLSPSTTVYTKLEGESVPDINCSADCLPGCTQVWMKGSSAVQESNGKTLSLRQVTREKAGDYTCCFNNTESRATGNISIKLIVQYKPIITTNAKYFDAEKGKAGHMHIEFYSGLFQPLITWYIVNNGTMELLQNSSHFRIYLSAVTVELKYYQKTIQLPGYNASLEVYDVNDEQFASYRVEINNSFAESVFATLQLKPRGPPETPANLNVVPDSITTHSLQLTWQAGFHGGASQTFFIQYREAGQINWLNKSEPSGFVLYVTLNSTITGLKDGTTYEFRIYSKNVFNRSQISSTINETTKTGEPETPTKFHITDVQEKQVTFQWLSGDHREFDTMFVIKISMDYFTWANASLINAGKKEGWFSATVTGLKSNTVYYFRLYSFNVNGESDFADIDLATRTLKESVSSLDIGASIGIGFGGFFLGVVGTISVIIVIWKRITATTKYNSTREADMSTNMQTYANIEVSSSPAPSHYEQLQQDHAEKTMYDCI